MIKSTSNFHPILSQTNLEQGILSEKVAVITGAGGGIGIEAARSLLWLGASVVIAEIDRKRGRNAEKSLAKEFGSDKVKFIRTDIGIESSVRNLSKKVFNLFKKVDILINNATVAPLGSIAETPISAWDKSYKVNLRGPVNLIRAFLPGMLERDDGIIANISSTGTAYMGAYETFKAALVHLTATLEAELEETGICVFTLGPGLVLTETATQAVKTLAPRMGMSLEDFYQINANHILSVEEAGAGYAAAIVEAKQFHGQEISSLQALIAIGYGKNSEQKLNQEIVLSENEREQSLITAKRVLDTFQSQTEGWKERSLFERQWMLRDFKKNAGMPVEIWLDQLNSLVSSLKNNTPIPETPLEKLSNYYEHMAELAKGYEKDQQKLAENLKHIYTWRDDVINLIKLLSKKA